MLLFMAMSWSSVAQDAKAFDADTLFALARTEVFQGKKAEGREKLKLILEEDPGYEDVRIFLARSYSWDGSYAEARRELHTTLRKDPTHRDAVYALADVELWSGNFADALEVVQTAMLTYPADEHLLYKEANALASLGRDAEALRSLEALMQLRPEHKEGTALYNSIDERTRKYTAGLLTGAEFFDRIFQPSYYMAVDMGRRNSWGSFHVRWNYARRFGTHGSQVEVDLYPRITKYMYAYVNYGYSESGLFPAHRIGTELFLKLPEGLETSAGVRYMAFDGDTKVAIYTGTVGWYFRSYWLSLRPFITPDSSGSSFSATMAGRRYFVNADNYLQLSAGLGFSPDLGRLQNAAGFSEDAIHLLKARRIGLAWQQKLPAAWTLNVSAEVCRQEVSFNENEYVLITGAVVSLRKKLK